jgi:RNA polymerase primary sigma factor
MKTIQDRYFSLLETPLRYFHDASFNDIKKRKEITAEMPDHESFIKGLEKIEKIKAAKISPEMIPCYKSPLLTFGQEQHLFRKMNYFKYRAKNIIASINPQNPSVVKIQNAEYMIQQARQVRNIIAESNFRLATQIMKHRQANSKEVVQTEILSDAYFDVIKAVDYFNWTLGHKFSTYATWVVKKNFFRDSKQKKSQSDKFVPLDDKTEIIESRSSDYEDVRDDGSRKKIIKSLIGLLVRENLGTDRVRQAYVLENYFGVNGRAKKTLEQISDEIGVTKERVRQLKEKGLEWIREKVENMQLEYDNDRPEETVF